MSSVIKSGTWLSGQTRAEPIPFNIEDIQARASDYLAEVRRQSEELLEKARQEAALIQSRARQAGLQAARDEMERRVEEAAAQLSDTRCRTAIAACHQSLDQLGQATAQWLVQWRNQTIDLACRIAEKLVRGTAQFNQELLRVWMEEALAVFRDEREVRILVHPDDFAVAGRFLQSMVQTMPHAASAAVLPDPQVQPGGCIVQSKNGRIDQQLESQLRRLAEQLHGE